MIELIDVEWHGPFGWPKFEGKLKPIPQKTGVYLMTVEYQTGHLIYAAGITRRPMPQRFREHTHEYMNGIYNVLDIAAMKAGFRKEIWHGLWLGKHPREKLAEFKKRKPEIQEAARKQLAGFRIFAANISTKRRILERIEAAIMDALYRQPLPLCDIPDKGMMLAPRWKLETPIAFRNKCQHTLYGLPSCLEI
jgi:hypothetical protein